jgi:hypothetical protein
MVLPDLQAGAILQALGETLPEADLSRLRAFLAGEGLLDDSDADARRIVDALKTAADRHWQINPQIHRIATGRLEPPRGGSPIVFVGWRRGGLGADLDWTAVCGSAT